MDVIVTPKGDMLGYLSDMADELNDLLRDRDHLARALFAACREMHLSSSTTKAEVQRTVDHFLRQTKKGGNTMPDEVEAIQPADTVTRGEYLALIERLVALEAGVQGVKEQLHDHIYGPATD